MKKILIILSAAIVIAGIGAGAFFYFIGSGDGIEIAGNPSFPETGDASFGIAENAPTGEVSNVDGGTRGGRLIKISAGVVVPGAAIVSKGDMGTSSPASTDIFFIERQSGHVFSYHLETGTLTRISNRTVPAIQEAYWLPDASRALVRYLSGNEFETIHTYFLPANGDPGSFFPENLTSVAVSSSSILIAASSDTGSLISLVRPDGTEAQSVFATPLSSIRASFAGKTSYLVATKASASLDGYAFLIDGKGDSSVLAGPLKGLTALASPSGAWIIISASDGRSMRTMLVRAETRETIELPIGTIADKCTWSADESVAYCGVPFNPPSGAYPDDWYRGDTAFSDRLWKIDVKGRFAERILDFSKETGVALDATSLATDANNRILVFTNKNDGSLWSYAL